MNKITCPKCKETFSINEEDYHAIALQIRDAEFNQQVEKRSQEIEALNKQELIRKYEDKLHLSELEKNNLKNEKDKEIAILKTQLKDSATINQTQIKESLSEKEKEIIELNAQINSLKAKNKDDLSNLESQKQIEINALKQEINNLKDFKARLSTKMVGESLEKHCEDEFNKLRSSLFPQAYFEKDNIVSASGSKGDYIYREYDQNGTEYISIMFEMKNESDQTVTKRKNEDFLKELDKDRIEKKCEYAVLVSLLEMDSDLYNSGIVDVSYKYPKMYIIRPQFFIPLITILKNAAQNSINVRNELEMARQKNIDITNFENNLHAFQEDFSRNYALAADRFSDAIKNIDKGIETLSKIKENLLKSQAQLGYANSKLDKLTVRKLTKNAPSVKLQFDELKNNNRK